MHRASARLRHERAMDAAAVPVVFEALSPTSGHTDRIIKVREYAGVPSVRRYVILEYTSVGLMAFERSDADEPWKALALTGEDVLRMPEIGIEIPVTAFHEGVYFGGDAALGEVSA